MCRFQSGVGHYSLTALIIVNEWNAVLLQARAIEAIQVLLEVRTVTFTKVWQSDYSAESSTFYP
jgi:hypothetical protein